MGWLDIFSLAATIAVFGGIVYGIVLVTKTINEGVTSTKQSLKSKGFDVTASGMSVKTSKRFDREDYVDATQRGMLKALEASSFRRPGPGSSSQPQAFSLDRTTSSTSTKSTSSDEKRKKRMFGGKK